MITKNVFGLHNKQETCVVYDIINVWNVDIQQPNWDP